MLELAPLIGTGLSGASVAILLLVLYRVTELEKDHKELRGFLTDTRERVIKLEIRLGIEDR